MSNRTISEDTYNDVLCALERAKSITEAVKHLDMELGMSSDCGLKQNTVCSLMFTAEKELDDVSFLIASATTEEK